MAEKVYLVTDAQGSEWWVKAKTKAGARYFVAQHALTVETPSQDDLVRLGRGGYAIHDASAPPSPDNPAPIDPLTKHMDALTAAAKDATASGPGVPA